MALLYFAENPSPLPRGDKIFKNQGDFRPFRTLTSNQVPAVAVEPQEPEEGEDEEIVDDGLEDYPSDHEAAGLANDAMLARALSLGLRPRQ